MVIYAVFLKEHETAGISVKANGGPSVGGCSHTRVLRKRFSLLTKRCVDTRK
jgi:hypothetical protein